MATSEENKHVFEQYNKSTKKKMSLIKKTNKLESVSTIFLQGPRGIISLHIHSFIAATKQYLQL